MSNTVDDNQNLTEQIKNLDLTLNKTEMMVNHFSKESRIIEIKLNDKEKEIFEIERKIKLSHSLFEKKMKDQHRDLSIDDEFISQELKADYSYSFWMDASLDSFSNIK